MFSLTDLITTLSVHFYLAVSDNYFSVIMLDVLYLFQPSVQAPKTGMCR